VTTLEMNDADRAVSRVLAETFEGRRLEVDAEVFVIATGGIETPRLLLNNTLQRPAGIGNENDLVGRHFMEHPQFTAGIALLAGEPNRWRQLVAVPTPEGSGFPPEVTTKGVLVPTDRQVLANERMAVESQVLLEPAANAPTTLGGDPDRPVSATQVGGLRAAAGTHDATVAIVQVLGEQEPNPNSRVTLGNDVDEFGMQRVQVDWQVTERDIDNMAWGARNLARELGRLSEGRLQFAPGGVAATDNAERLASAAGILDRLDVDPSAAEREPTLAHANHHMGTTRMTVDPSKGVVDVNCRLHSVENLYVAGSAVFPVSGAAPPTFNLVALAARLAAHLDNSVLP